MIKLSQAALMLLLCTPDEHIAHSSSMDAIVSGIPERDEAA